MNNLEVNKLYFGDALDILKIIPNNSINLILTDPPYFISRKTNFKSNDINSNKKYNKLSMEFGEWDNCIIDFKPIFKEYYRVLKPGGTIIFFYDIFKMESIKNIAEELKFKQPRIGFWNKTNTVPINSKINYLSNSREYFISFVKNKKNVFNSKYDKGVYDYPIVGGKEKLKHTTQKPVKLFIDLINVHTNPGDVVLDTFGGSGTTAIASISTNRNYILIEKNKTYFDLSQNRISLFNKLNKNEQKK